MSLPFSADAFFEVFARYNETTWPMVLALWLAAATALVGVVRQPGRRASRRAAAVLATLWAWSGVVYHAAFFTTINPAAWLFAALFVLQALLIGEHGVRRGGFAFGEAKGLPRLIGISLAVYALTYPLVSIMTGHPYPTAPTFGVPCPTDIYTIGLLLTLPVAAPLAIVVVAVLWAIIGGSAALVLGVPSDIVLLVCGAVAPADWLVKTRSGRRGARPRS